MGRPNKCDCGRCDDIIPCDISQECFLRSCRDFGDDLGYSRPEKDRFEWLFIVSGYGAIDIDVYINVNEYYPASEILFNTSDFFDEEDVLKAVILTTSEEHARIFQQLKNRTGY